MSEKEQLTKRINVIIDKHCGGYASRFGEKIGLTRGTAAKIANGTGVPSFQTIQGILKAFPHINARWFILGVGENEDAEKSQEANNIQVNEPKVNYKNDSLLELMKEQFKIKDQQIAELIKRIK